MIWKPGRNVEIREEKGGRIPVSCAALIVALSAPGCAEDHWSWAAVT